MGRLRKMGDDYQPPMTPEEAIEVYQAQLAALEAKVRQVCEDAWANLPDDPRERKAYLELVMMDTIGVLGDMAAELGAQHVTVYRAANGYEPGQVVTSSMESETTIKRRRSEIEQIMDSKGSDEAFALFERRAVASVLGRSRNTVLNSAAAVGNAWCRVPEPGACWFCLMLASRGAVYHEQATALGTKHYHAHCRCTAAEVFGDEELPQSTAACVKWYEEHGQLNKWHVSEGDFTEATGIISSTLEHAHDTRLGRSRVPEDFTPVVLNPQALIYAPPVWTTEDVQVNLHGEPKPNGYWKGGHLSGTGAPRKTEFPSTWDEEDIERATLLTFLDPQFAKIQGDRRIFRRDVNGIIVEAACFPQADGSMKFVHSFPKCGDGVWKNEGGETEAGFVPYNIGYLDGTIEP